MRINTKIIITTMTLTLALLGCGKKEEPIIRPVEITKAVKVPTTLEYEYPGIVTSENEAPLSFMFGGKIAEMNVEVGSFVKKGDKIASVLKRDYEANYLAAKAVAENAEKQFKRVETLYKAKALPKKTYDTVLADVEVAKQAAQFAKNKLEDTIITAPYDGYITKKFLGLGAVADPGLPVVTISSVGESLVRISVSENDVNNMENVTKSTFNYNGHDYKLVLADVGKSKGTLRLAYPVTFKFEKPEEKLLTDSNGIVTISFKNNNYQKGILIPVESIFEKSGEVKVWIYNDDEHQVHEESVKIVKPYSDGKVIITGLEEGEQVVTKGVHELIEGQKVKVVEPFSKSNIGEML